MAYHLTREALILDLHAAFQCARRHKDSKPYVRHFMRRLEHNIGQMADELLSRTYRPQPSTVFIVDYPKKREVFAAQFRDRIVHHLYYNYTHQMYERTFVADSYSCIEGRGTHYGINRLKHHIRRSGHGGQRDCYVMRIDIRGYFMHIDRQRLLDIALGTLHCMSRHRISRHGRATWADWVDIDFVEWLTREIVMLDPRQDCRMVGSADDWAGLDTSKSLFHTADGCGLPIGNLTSQLLSNVYLNELDQYCKRTLGCRHYGRYVDDAYIVSHDRQWLLSLAPRLQAFLTDRLRLQMHMGKLSITRASYGAEFLGAFVKPGRTYVSNASVRRMTRSVQGIDVRDTRKTDASVNSFLGVMQHYDSYNIRTRLLLVPRLLSVGRFNGNMTQFAADVSKPMRDRHGI